MFLTPCCFICNRSMPCALSPDAGMESNPKTIIKGRWACCVARVTGKGAEGKSPSSLCEVEREGQKRGTAKMGRDLELSYQSPKIYLLDKRRGMVKNLSFIRDRIDEFKWHSISGSHGLEGSGGTIHSIYKLISYLIHRFVLRFLTSQWHFWWVHGGIWNLALLKKIWQEIVLVVYAPEAFLGARNLFP